ncbi:MAG: septum formation initiator family protein [Clostridia bacterium]|nr:septum formation initiator family protein [Clostridia bacterium]
MSMRRSRILRIIAAAVLFLGLFVQITMLSRISEKSKQASALEKEIVMLSAEADNLELGINQYHNLEKIAARAQTMGMVQPDETQIRVVSVD